MSKVFKCAESQEHVDKANVSVDDVVAVLAFFELAKIPTKWTVKSVREACKDSSSNHDVAHVVLDDLVAAWKSGNEFISDSLFTEMMVALEKKQIECRLGHDHAE